ncbi:MAG: hypothetical protein AAFV25_09165 [Bacteroidota bacterium]
MLVLFLVVMPLGSWYYLQSGFNYHKKALAELRDYGELPTFALTDQSGLPFTRDSLMGSIAIAGFFDRSDNSSKDLFHLVSRLHEQFDDRKGILFLLHDLNANSSSSDLQQLANQHQLLDARQIRLLTSADSESMQSLLQKGYRVPDMDKGRDEEGNFSFVPASSKVGEYPYLVITDTKGGVRNYYTYNDIASQKRLIEHIALTMPRKDKKSSRRATNQENL